MFPIELGKETDKAGHILTMYQSLELGMSPAFSTFLRHYSETVELGYAYPKTLWNDKTCGVIYAQHEEKIVGQITYDTQNVVASGALWIVLSYTEETYRRLGIYKILHRYLDKFAKDNNFTEVASFVHIRNENQIQALDSVGKKPIFYVVGKRI